LVMLAEADPSCLSANNDWQLAPLSVAYLKGHYGIVEWLVDGPCSSIVDVNCRDQSGATLLSSAIKFYDCFDDKNILKQLQFLIGKGANCSLKDARLNSPFHYFCCVPCKLFVEDTKDSVDEDENKKRLTKDEYRRCVDLLLASGVKLMDKNDEGEDALQLAIKAGNLFLAELILEKLLVQDPTLQSLDVQSSTKNKEYGFLHALIALPFQVYNDRFMWARKYGPAGGQYNIIPFLDKLISLNPERIRQWLWHKDANGQTSLTFLCRRYAEIQRENRGGSQNERSLKEFLSTMCAVVRHLARLDPKILLQNADTDDLDDYSPTDRKADAASDEDSGSGDTNEAENLRVFAQEEETKSLRKFSVLRYALEADGSFSSPVTSIVVGSETYHITNKLLMTVVEAAKEYRILHEAKSARKFSVLRYALEADGSFSSPVTSIVVGSETYHITNKLLMTVIEAAKEYRILHKILNERDADGYTSLLRVVSSGDLAASMYLLGSAHSLPNDESVERVDAATVEYRYCATEKKCE
uniref:ANK_REP_REGION domain-containing protein n=1 Tax=Gongylonema pulchrum TaxID=637853 RepID=A0A183EER0_9BILA